jgi:hypothetical protein
MPKPLVDPYVIAQQDVVLPNGGVDNKRPPRTDIVNNGFDFGQTFPANEFNALLNNLGEWVEYLASRVESLEIQVGGLYFNVNDDTNPGSSLGYGTWSKVEGSFIYATSSGDSGGETGGSENHTHSMGLAGDHTHGGTNSTTLTENQIPSHSHNYRDRYYIENDTDLDMQNSLVTNKETAPTGYNNNVGPDGSDSDNDTWLYYDTTTENTGGGQGHSHSIDPDGEHNHSLSTESSLPPYLKVHVWRRIA